MRALLGTVLCTIIGVGAADLPGSRPALATARAWATSGERTEAELHARLGPPDRVEVVPDAERPGTFALTWEEAAWIRVTFRGGKARRLEGHFDPHAAGGVLTLDTFRKLRPGMTRKALAALLGAPDEDRAFGKDMQRCEWARRSDLTVRVMPAAPALVVGSRPPLRKESRQWLEEGRGRLTEDAVLRKLGRPDFVFNPGDPDTGEGSDELGLLYREQARIEVDIRDGSAVRLHGQFAPHARSERVTFERLRKLHAGMKEAAVEEVLGLPDDETRPERGLRRQVWLARHELVVYIRAGKVKGVTWWGPF